MADHVETMAYRAEGGVPWHGFGNPVSNDMTPDEMVTAAGLNWKVEKRPLYFPIPNDEGKTVLRIVPGEYGLVRDTDNAYYDTVGENWKCVQNHEIADFFSRFVKAGDMQMETMGSLKGGKFIWALARINESFSLGKGDETRGYLLLSQPHQFGFSMTAALTPIRVVCWNTICYALGSRLNGSGGRTTASFRMTHAREFNDVAKAEAERALGLAHTEMKAFSLTAEMLSGVRAKQESVTEYFHRIMNLEEPEEGLPEDEDLRVNRTVRRFQEALTSAPGQELFKETWWNAYNSVSYVVDHELGRSKDNRLFNAWFGSGATKKRKALELAVDFANAA
jgi:phage/plasmid-like protein (TIGR03299 family)